MRYGEISRAIVIAPLVHPRYCVIGWYWKAASVAVAVAVWAETSKTTDPTQVIHDGVQVVGELGLAFHSWLGLDCCVSRLFGCSLVGGFSGVLVGGYIVVTCDF